MLKTLKLGIKLSCKLMQCPKCKSSQNKKNGFRRGKQSYKCKDCGCQYVENPISRGYTSQVKQICLKMSVDLKVTEE